MAKKEQRREIEKQYKSLTGHDYWSSKDGSRIRVEAGETLHDFPARAVNAEFAAGKIEEAEKKE